ncbi:MAG: serine hydrolase [Bryobacterales bacterium]|nr:serine hydrolase [Bryobacterales bacterium]MBV9398459.1 serine hydrolase [Bryobacterales bacterium]
MLSRVLATTFLAGACLAQNNDSRMDQIVQSYVPKQFMGSVLVARGNDVLLNKGYGSANLEWDIANSPLTKFRLGSVTKQFTAASVLLLEERGKLKIDDPVKKYMPDAPAAWDKMTIFHVLTHTAGIPNFTGFADYQSTEALPATPEKLVTRFRDKPLEFEPGEKWNYSNSGYVLLGYLIEKISGETYEKFLQENIFGPLGMKDSGYDSNSAVIPRRAAGYAPGPNGPVNAGFINMTVPFSAGALYSTTGDLLKWEQGLFAGKVLSAASLAKMTTPFKNDYAFGLGVHTVKGHKAIDHNGGIEGFNTILAYYPEDKLTVVVLGNLNGAAPEDIATKLAAIAHGEAVKLQSEREQISIDPAVLAREVGAYQLAPGVTMLVTLDGNQLMTKLGNQQRVPIFPESQTMFFAKVVDAQIEFAKPDAQGIPGQLILHQNGRDQTANRLSDAEFKQIAAAADASDKRFKDQTAAPGSEAAVRRIIEELRTGKPNYDLMGAGLAAATRQQLPQLQTLVSGLGAVQQVSFKGVGPGGADIYEIRFANGALEYRLSMGADGKVEGANVRPVQ